MSVAAQGAIKQLSPSKASRSLAASQGLISFAPSAAFHRSLRSAAELNDLLNAQTLDLSCLTAKIRAILPLASLVLRVSNFPPVGGRPNAATIEEAAVLLGADKLRVLIFSSIFLADGLSDDQTREMARHCLLSAILAERLAHWTGYAEPAKASLPGLLHTLLAPDLADSCCWRSQICVGWACAQAFSGAAETELGEFFEWQRRTAPAGKSVMDAVKAACMLAAHCVGPQRAASSLPAAPPERDCGLWLRQSFPGLGSHAHSRLARLVSADLAGLLPFSELALSEAVKVHAEMAFVRMEEAG